MSDSPTVQTVLTSAVSQLTLAGVPNPRVDAELLVGHVLDLNRGQVQSKAITDAAIDAAQATRIAELVERRAAREPLQHITGRAPFRALNLAVGPGVFVPRPETEQVVQFAIDALRATAAEAPIGIDLGTGSGAIALAMATEVPHARVYGVEVSPLAFVWTKQNFREFGGDNATPIFTDLAVALPELDGTVSVVISNPPYIPRAAIPRDPEVRLFDPEIALYGGDDGLDVVHQVSATAWRLLHSGGTLVMEHGELQAAEIAALLRADGWTAVASHRDLLGRDRSTTALRP
ncbi:release factor glutamine methyltransferase [Conyzicola lurida]|uniref:Release factor glutamine methyltransferase n=1 Tax=Conyzicola lurida TaxID=1172621 RepID=A0A841AMB5_9MICO|nr:peptide chain release factor N(5)-glutamine methyltransferase [Conyzicola lurida]MBB5842665.1 release factor glutamine methyltransferase [Conyzicola lurida]